MGPGSMRRNFAAGRQHIIWVLEDAYMSKRDWMQAIAYGAIFTLSGAMLVYTFL